LTLWLVDTSVAVPLAQSSHQAHDQVRLGVGDRRLGLTAHSALETYSVLTRLPGDARLTPADAATLIYDRFGPIVELAPETGASLVQTFADANIAGGAAYDALIGLTAKQADATLLTRDARARATYIAIGVKHEVIE
jgi:toxin FitB